MSLITTLDITQIVTTTVKTVDPATSISTSVGSISTQLGNTTTSTVATVLQTGLQGDQGIVGPTGASAYEIWIDNGGIGTEQDFLDSLVSTVPGPIGLTGPQGAPGPQGVQGIQGIKGDTGLTGPQGIQGVAGQDGLDGISAYQVAVKNGYVGTESEWLVSLVGPKGDTGATGSQGIQGIQGVKGDTGEQGPTGLQGIQGPAGVAGYTPIKGVDYFDGSDGHSPVVTLVGDQLSIDNVIHPTHLTGPAGSDSPLGEAPIDGKQYARKDGAWVEVNADMATFDAVLDFGRGNMVATATIVDATMTNTKIIQAFYQNNLDEVAILNMRVTERSRSAGVGFDIIGVAPQGAFGIYNVRCIVSGL